MPENPQATSPAPVPLPPPRLESVDLLRGLVMVLMALDHTRDFFSRNAVDPTDLAHASAPLFLTRWITHICAPVFLLLAGTGAFLSTTRGKTTRELSWFLLTRGLWLVFLEVTYVNWFGWRFEFTPRSYGLQVIFVIGCSMLALAALIWLPRRVILVFGVVLIAGHNAFDGIKPADVGAWAGLLRLLHTSGGFDAAGVHFEVGYPVIPWIGVMAVGYALGPVLRLEATDRRRWLLTAGAALTLLFVLIRLTNLYGDPNPWSSQWNPLFTLFSFLNCSKYPPSLCFLLMTIGLALLLLALFDRGTPKPLQPLRVFGRVPLFFYLLHLPVIHALSLLARQLFHRGAPPTEAAFGLVPVYLFWILIVVLLYPVCHWFAKLKRTRRAAWLSYI